MNLCIEKTKKLIGPVNRAWFFVILFIVNLIKKLGALFTIIFHQNVSYKVQTNFAGM